MTCSRCHKKIERETPRCPHCGLVNPGGAGTFQVSTVLISAAGADRVYRSVEEVPARLRTRLLKSTNSPNSATILIADRRGRKEIARAMRKLPGPAQRRLMRSVLASDAGESAPAWLTSTRRAALIVVIAMFCLAVVAALFSHPWPR